jgi:hypothetical protein
VTTRLPSSSVTRNAPQGQDAPASVPPDYDALTDIRESVRVGLAAIRERVRSGGKGWGK